MSVVGLSEEEQMDVYRLVSIVLWLGNLQFQEDNREHSQIVSTDGTVALR